MPEPERWILRLVLPSPAKQVMEAIIAMDKEGSEQGNPHPELSQRDVNEWLERTDGDPETDEALGQLAERGYIEPVLTGYQQLRGPLTFRLHY